MINLRFHIVSLVAVFLALAIGIAVGATVVDQGLVGKLNGDIDRFDRQLRERATTIDDLKQSLALAQRFGRDGEARIVRDRLRTVPVLVVVAAGIDEGAVRTIEARLGDAGASVQGELRVLPRMGLGATGDYDAVHRALDTASVRPETLRVLLRRRLVDAIVRPDETPSLESLLEAGFVGFRVGGRSVAVPAFAVGTRVVVLSGQKAQLPDDSFLMPFLSDLALDSSARAIAADIGGIPVKTSARSTSLVEAVRANRGLASKVSTVDDLDQVAGRVGVVFALEDLARNRTGHYGVGKDADALLPAA